MCDEGTMLDWSESALGGIGPLCIQQIATVSLPRVSKTCIGINQRGQFSRRLEGMVGLAWDSAECSFCQV